MLYITWSVALLAAVFAALGGWVGQRYAPLFEFARGGDDLRCRAL